MCLVKRGTANTCIARRADSQPSCADHDEHEVSTSPDTSLGAATDLHVLRRVLNDRVLHALTGLPSFASTEGAVTGLDVL